MSSINPNSSIAPLLSTQEIAQSAANQKKIAGAYEAIKEQQQIQDLQASAAATPFKKFDAYLRALA